MVIAIGAPVCDIEELLSSAMEIGPDFGYIVRLSAIVLAAVTRSADISASRRRGRSGLEGDRLEVMLGWPFTPTQKRMPTSICLSSADAVKIIAALNDALQRLSDVALATATLVGVSVLALSSNGPRFCRRECVDIEISAMREVVKAYIVGGGVWPGTGLRVFQPSFAKAPLVTRVLSAEFLADPEDESPRTEKSQRDAAVDLCTAESSVGRRHGLEAATPPMDGTKFTSSHPVDLELFGLPWSQEGDERRPKDAKSTPLDDPPVVAVADSQKNAPVQKPCSSSPSVVVSRHDRSTYIAPTGRSSAQPRDPLYVRPSASCGGDGQGGSCVTSRERSRAAPPTAPGRKSSSPPTVNFDAPNAANASSAKLRSSASSRGRRRVPSSSRGRPSCSPSRSPSSRSLASPPARSASRYPERTRGGTMASSPRKTRRSSVSKEDMDGAPNLRFHSPPPQPDLQQSCCEVGGGFSGFLEDNSRVGDAFWSGERARRSSSFHEQAMYNMLESRKQEPLSKERGTPAVSSSALDQEKEAIALKEKTAREEEVDAAATATAAADRKAARRVTWHPLVIARDDAAAVIRPFVQRYADAGVQECRVAHSARETWKFIERRAEQQRGQGRRPMTARPVAQRGAFFGMVSSLSNHRSTWRKWMDYMIMEETCTEFVPLGLTGSQVPVAWVGGGGGGDGGGGGGSGYVMAGKQASAGSAPPRRINLGDIVRQVSTTFLSRGA